MRPWWSESSGVMHMTSKRRKKAAVVLTSHVLVHILPSGHNGGFWTPGQTTNQVGRFGAQRPPHAVHAGPVRGVGELYRRDAAQRCWCDAR